METRLVFFSDPHLGLTRNTHTTPASRERLRQAVYDNAIRTIQLIDKYPSQVITICLGDLFDTHQNDANTLIQGYAVFYRCNWVITGNHDVSNRKDKSSTLDALKQIYGIEADPSGTEYVKNEVAKDNKYAVVIVEHKLTQEIFEATLSEAATAHQSKETPAILLLHCNYDSPFADNESTLNLTKENAEELLTVFDYILIGHEHQPRTDFDGRLILVGNTHPTSFADISDKFYWTIDFDQETCRFSEPEKHLIWSASDCALEIPWDYLQDRLNRSEGLPETIKFITVSGIAPADKMPVIAKMISDLWKLSDNLLMVRNNVVSEELALENKEQVNITQNIPNRITSMLEGSDIQETWLEYLNKLEAV